MSIVLTLQARGAATAADLAGDLGVSPRTIYRDLDALQVAGVPVYGEPGHGGGYRLVAGYRTRLTGLTPDEATSLALVRLPETAEALGRSVEAEVARLKMLAALPPGMAAAAQRSANLFHLDSSPWYQEPDPTPFLPVIAAAVWEGHLISVVYRRWRAPAVISRELAPLGLVLKGNTWYLVAAGADQAGPDFAAIRTFRVSEMLDVVGLDRRFDQPVSFNLAGHWRESTALFEKELLHGLLATVIVDDQALRAVEAHRLPAIRDAGRAAIPRKDGRRELRLPLESVSHAIPVLRALGPGIEVVAPAELRASVIADLRELLAPYVAEGVERPHDAGHEGRYQAGVEGHPAGHPGRRPRHR